MSKLALILSIAGLAAAQSPEPKKLEFEVASIRPATRDEHQSVHSDKGRFQTHNLTLKRLTALAYNVEIDQVFGGPPWADSDSYDVNAKIPEGLATTENLPQMVQSMLVDRFKFAAHRETREMPGFNLVLAKKGSKMKPAQPAENSSTHTNNSHMTATNLSTEDL